MASFHSLRVVTYTDNIEIKHNLVPQRFIYFVYMNSNVKHFECSLYSSTINDVTMGLYYNGERDDSSTATLYISNKFNFKTN